MPVVSVIIPTYNDDGIVLRATIESALAQTYSSIEVIVVDDGSDMAFGGLQTDTFDSRVKWLELKKNTGVAHARNIGVARSSGSILSFLDTGDAWDERKIEAQVTILLRKGLSCALVFTGARIHTVYGSVLTLRPRPAKDWVKELLIGQPITGSASAVVVPRTTFDAVGGFFEEVDIPEDRDLWLRLAMAGEVAYVDLPLTHIRMRRESRSSDARAKEISYRAFLERHALLITEQGLSDRAWAHYHSVIASMMLKDELLRDGIKHSILALKHRRNPAVLFRVCTALIARAFGVRYDHAIDVVRNVKKKIQIEQGPKQRPEIDG